MKKVLVAEDEESIREFIVINLTRSGYEVEQAENGAVALDLFSKNENSFDVAILDIMMPEVDGLTVCKELRKRSSDLGIIMLSAKTQEMDKVTGLLVGADDYVTKPFGVAELVARVNSLLRRVKKTDKAYEHEQDIMVSGPFTLDFKSRVMHKGDTVIDLTSVEFSIMELFFKNEGTALVREKILEGVWGENYFGDIKIVDVNIRRLRMKIEDDPSNRQHIVTVWGYGYRWSV